MRPLAAAAKVGGEGKKGSKNETERKEGSADCELSPLAKAGYVVHTVDICFSERVIVSLQQSNTLQYMNSIERVI